MEVSIVIKLPDGSTRTVELVNANIQTSWSHGFPVAGNDPLQPPQTPLIGNLTLQGIVKDASLVGTV
jgi:hypothetical protein